MTFTYGQNPAGSVTDAIRLLCGDTDSTQYYLEDSEVEYVAGLQSNVWFAASMAAQAIAGKLAKSVDRTVGKLSIKGTDLAKQYQALALELRRRGALDGLTPVLVAESISAKEQQVLNTDRVPPMFARRTQDYPGVGPLAGEEGYFELTGGPQ